MPDLDDVSALPPAPEFPDLDDLFEEVNKMSGLPSWTLAEVKPVVRADLAETQIKALLDELAALREDARTIIEARDERRAEILAPLIPASVQAQLETVERVAAEETEIVQERIGRLEERIRKRVLAFGKRVDGERLMAVVAKGRVSWDASGLEGYALAVPEILKFRKEGDPSVSIRERKT